MDPSHVLIANAGPECVVPCFEYFLVRFAFHEHKGIRLEDITWPDPKLVDDPTNICVIHRDDRRSPIFSRNQIH